MELRGAVVVVTGASSGFGELAAIRFARAGAAVVLAARRLERLEAIAAWIERRGGRALPARCDVTDPSSLAALHDRVEGEHGRCDVLVNNAGVAGGGAFELQEEPDIERVVRTNLLGVLHGTRLFLPGMLERGRGHVVNVASLAGRFAIPGSAVYGATKHAVVAFGEALHHEVADRGVLVTSVNPGLSRTEGFPQTGVPSAFLLDPDRVAKVVVDVVRRNRAPEVSVPRALAPFQVFRVLTPPLYRWGVRLATRRLLDVP
ncbi:MAG TPA: SDR family oxidoreductase [Actinomycetota bacterium]|nr:SDR family oxidoreductase [Actinomycetota bacterium]